MRFLLFFLYFFLPLVGNAKDNPEVVRTISEEKLHYLARIELHTAKEIEDLFSRAEKLLSQKNTYSLGSPIAFVLHGPEVELFARTNYPKFRKLVDDAAKLDAFRVIDLKVCESYMREHNISREAMPPFVEVVPFGPEEEGRLRANGYQDF